MSRVSHFTKHPHAANCSDHEKTDEAKPVQNADKTQYIRGVGSNTASMAGNTKAPLLKVTTVKNLAKWTHCNGWLALIVAPLHSSYAIVVATDSLPACHCTGCLAAHLHKRTCASHRAEIELSNSKHTSSKHADGHTAGEAQACSSEKGHCNTTTTGHMERPHTHASTYP